MIDIESMRQLDTGALVTLKQRIERELMRRGDVEQAEWVAAERITDETKLFAVDGAIDHTPTPLAQRQLLREPDSGCTRCWGRGTQVSYSNATVALTKLCPCLWGGE